MHLLYHRRRSAHAAAQVLLIPWAGSSTDATQSSLCLLSIQALVQELSSSSICGLGKQAQLPTISYLYPLSAQALVQQLSSYYSSKQGYLKAKARAEAEAAAVEVWWGAGRDHVMGLYRAYFSPSSSPLFHSSISFTRPLTLPLPISALLHPPHISAFHPACDTICDTVAYRMGQLSPFTLSFLSSISSLFQSSHSPTPLAVFLYYCHMVLHRHS